MSRKILRLRRLRSVILAVILTLLFTSCDALQKAGDEGDGTPTPTPSSVIEPYEEDQTPDNNTNAPDDSDNQGEQNSGSNQDQLRDVADYFPIYENVRMVYEGQGNEFAFFNSYVDYAVDNKVQIRSDNGGTQSIKVIEIREDAIVQTLFLGETYYRENLLNAQGEEKILLKEPIALGTSWDTNDGMRKVTGIDIEIDTPNGTLKAVEVTEDGTYGITIDYYVKDVGLVKTVFKSEGAEVSSTLKEIERDKPFVQIVNFYFPSIENESLLYYVSNEIPFRTNDVTRMILEEAYKGIQEEGIAPVLTENTKVKSLYLNQDGMVYVDLSRDFPTEMSAGAGYETAMLQSIANTFGQYYHVEKVLLTIENELYSSGHISLEKGQPLLVNYEISKSIKGTT